jgi:hypothetical protein
MKKHTLLKRAAAAALLSATLATPAVVGLATGTANAKPREGDCASIALAFESSIYMANQAQAQGEDRLYQEYMRDAVRAHRNYDKFCRG